MDWYHQLIQHWPDHSLRLWNSPASRGRIQNMFSAAEHKKWHVLGWNSSGDDPAPHFPKTMKNWFHPHLKCFLHSQRRHTEVLGGAVKAQRYTLTFCIQTKWIQDFSTFIALYNCIFQFYYFIFNFYHLSFSSHLLEKKDSTCISQNAELHLIFPHFCCEHSVNNKAWACKDLIYTKRFPEAIA